MNTSSSTCSRPRYTALPTCREGRRRASGNPSVRTVHRMRTHIPYYSSYGSPELILEFADGRRRLDEDPRWRRTGAASPEEYALWARSGCGMACLQMLLSAHFLEVPSLVELGTKCEAYGGYRRAGSRVEGLFYAPFVDYCGREFGLKARVMAPLSTEGMLDCVSNGEAVLASVNKGIREPETVPLVRGGHLVLVIAARGTSLCFHNPSGHSSGSQAGVWMTSHRFDTFFAGRGIAVALGDVGD